MAFWKSIDIMSFAESKREFHTRDSFANFVSIVYIWLLYLCFIGHVRKKGKMASGETMTATMSGMNCTVRSTTGEEAGVRAGVRAGA